MLHAQPVETRTLGHQMSIDIDMFTDKAFDAISKFIPKNQKAVRQQG